MSLLSSYAIAATIPEYVKQRKNGTSMIPQITKRDVPCQNRAEDHAAADKQSAPPIAPSPDGNRGIHEKDKQQE